MPSATYSISTWSLHGLLASGTSLMRLPQQIAEHGIAAVEICHFHFPGVEAAYLSDLKAALNGANVAMSTVLIDTGDIASQDPVTRDADINTIRSWIEVASALGSKRVRVSAGQQPPTADVVARSASGLAALAEFASQLNVELITENWQRTSLEPLPLLEILKRTDHKVGLCADTGNAEGSDKFETLKLLIPRATALHFKAKYLADGQIDRDDLRQIIELIREAHYTGLVTLIYGDTTHEWQALDHLKTTIDTELKLLEHELAI